MPNTRICWTTLLLTVAIALTADVTRAQTTTGGNPERQETQTADDFTLGRPWGIVGTWLGTTGTGAKLLTTFHADGTVINSVQGAVSTNPARPPHTSHHGLWRYLGEGRFGVTMWDIFYDIGTGQLIQYTKIRLEVTLGADRDEASARSMVEFLDPQGVVLQSRSGTTTYRRIPFEPLE